MKRKITSRTFFGRGSRGRDVKRENCFLSLVQKECFSGLSLEMDADYLKKNVNEALTEALASMAVGMPDDKVEYMGRYLKQYVERKSLQNKMSEEAGEAESKWAAYEVENNAKKSVRAAEDTAKADKASELTTFLEGLETSVSSKQDLMDKVTAFTAEYMKVPACYVGVKKTIGEADKLFYYSANPAQKFLVGKTLDPPTGEGEDDAPKRQGLTFECFKAPEAPEVEPPEDAPEDWKAPPPPGPQPLSVENVMRDTRCKFYGIPKLGSFLAVPFSYASCDHVDGIIPAEPVAAAEGEAEPAPEGEGEGEGEAAPVVPTGPKWQASKTVTNAFCLCMDTIGDYRAFSAKDVEMVKQIGDRMVAVMESLEGKMFDAQAEFLDKVAENGAAEKIATAVAALADSEAEALAAVAAELTATVPEPVEPVDGEEAPEAAEPTPVSETLKAFKEAEAVLRVHTTLLASEDIAGVIKDVKNHVLPVPASVVSLLSAISMLVGSLEGTKDASGDASWEAMRATCIDNLGAAMDSYNVSAAVTVSADTSVAGIKAYMEANGVPGEYPATLPTMGPLAVWLGKALAARDAAMVYNTEDLQATIETVA